MRIVSQTAASRPSEPGQAPLRRLFLVMRDRRPDPLVPEGVLADHEPGQRVNNLLHHMDGCGRRQRRQRLLPRTEEGDSVRSLLSAQMQATGKGDPGTRRET